MLTVSKYTVLYCKWKYYNTLPFLCWLVKIWKNLKAFTRTEKSLLLQYSAILLSDNEKVQTNGIKNKFNHKNILLYRKIIHQDKLIW